MQRLFADASNPSFGGGRISVPNDPPATNLIRGNKLAALKSRVREECPKLPGVYGMCDATGGWIYVGKSKALRNRLLTYFNSKTRASKERRILDRTCAIGWEPAPSEFAALLRELELIQRWRPRFNVLGQPGSREYAYVCIGKAPAPYAYVAMKPGADTISWFGPVPNTMRTREAVRRLNDVFQLRDCPRAIEMVFSDRPELFPIINKPGCLRMEVDTCLGPCAGACSQRQYSRQVNDVRAFLAGDDVSHMDRLRENIQRATHSLEFERAESYFNILADLEWLLEQLGRLRIARGEYSFVYPVRGVNRQTVWYLIHGGLVVDAVVAPRAKSAGDVIANRLQGVFSQPPVNAGPRTIHELDLLMLVASWFRNRPAELEKALTVDEALERCHQCQQAKSPAKSRSQLRRSA